MSYSREEFEQAFLNQYTDFERFENGEYMDDFLQQSWIGWQASRQEFEGEPVAIVDRVGIMQRLSPYTNLPEGTKLYTHPASRQAVSVPDEPTDKMLEACLFSDSDKRHPANAKRYLRRVYKTMIQHLPPTSAKADAVYIDRDRAQGLIEFIEEQRGRTDR